MILVTSSSLVLQQNFLSRITSNVLRYLRTSSICLNKPVPLHKEDVLINKHYDAIPGPTELPVVGTLLPYILGK